MEVLRVSIMWGQDDESEAQEKARSEPIRRGTGCNPAAKNLNRANEAALLFSFFFCNYGKTQRKPITGVFHRGELLGHMIIPC